MTITEKSTLSLKDAEQELEAVEYRRKLLKRLIDVLADEAGVKPAAQQRQEKKVGV